MTHSTQSCSAQAVETTFQLFICGLTAIVKDHSIAVQLVRSFVSRSSSQVVLSITYLLICCCREGSSYGRALHIHSWPQHRLISVLNLWCSEVPAKCTYVSVKVLSQTGAYFRMHCATQQRN